MMTVGTAITQILLEEPLRATRGTPTPALLRTLHTRALARAFVVLETKHPLLQRTQVMHSARPSARLRLSTGGARASHGMRWRSGSRLGISSRLGLGGLSVAVADEAAVEDGIQIHNLE